MLCCSNLGAKLVRGHKNISKDFLQPFLSQLPTSILSLRFALLPTSFFKHIFSPQVFGFTI